MTDSQADETRKMPTIGTLAKMFKTAPEQVQEPDRELKDVFTDSRQTGPDSLFAALPTARGHGLDHLDDAVSRGCRAMVYFCPPHQELSAEQQAALERAKAAGMWIVKGQPDLSAGALAAWFYGYPSNRLKVIGVTGTNGKTTTTQLVAQWLELGGEKCGVIGTLGWGFLPKLTPAPNTTPEPVSLQRELRRMADAGAGYVAMEVSSIGVVQGRIEGCDFYAGALTNLTRDHLDYHGNMTNYAEAKERFLNSVPENRLVVNGDDDLGRVLTMSKLNLTPFTFNDEFERAGVEKKFVKVRQVSYIEHGIKLEVESRYGTDTLTAPLLGRFNAENLCCAMSLLLVTGHPFASLVATAGKLRPIRGRMECFRGSQGPLMIVDYAHTPDGVEQALRAVREHFPHRRVWCVVGCGGDRDRGKRPIMAIKASVYADRAIFTSDNPRSENPEQILKDMAMGVSQAKNTEFIADRESAVRKAFTDAGGDDVVLVAGKGHEDYQIFADRTIHFSDRELCGSLTGDKHD